MNLLIAGIIQNYSLHVRARSWLMGRQIVLCPLVEPGYLRISTHKKLAMNLTMEIASQALTRFARERKALRISDDLPALECRPRIFDEVTDHYLANLAAKHGLRRATFDAHLKHHSAELVS